MGKMSVSAMFCLNEFYLFLKCFGGVVHNMDKKETKFSSGKKNKKTIKKQYFFTGYNTRAGGREIMCGISL
jgi:hypothetical protein